MLVGFFAAAVALYVCFFYCLLQIILRVIASLTSCLADPIWIKRQGKTVFTK